MALILTESLPYNFVFWEGILRQRDLDHLVWCVCETVVRVNQLLKVSG